MTTERLYGNWMRPGGATVRGIGWRLGATLAATYLVGLYLVQTSPATGVCVLAAGVIVAALSAVRVGGQTAAQWAGVRTRWLVASQRGQTEFRAVAAEGWKLPALLTGTSVVDVPSASTYGAVLDARSRRLAVTLRVASTAADLIDPEEHDAAVGRWERWLEALGRRPEVAAVTVTVETSPSPGTRLRDVTARRMADEAPADCRALLTTLVDASPMVAAETETRVTVSFDLRAWDTQLSRSARRVGIHAYLPLLDQAVTALESTLDGCGVTVVGRARSDELAATMRVAFDPASAGTVELALAAGLTGRTQRREVPGWEHSGPAAASEFRDAYVHDSGTSVSFVWAQAPRQLVGSTVLDAVARPGSFRKRFTCTYVATPAAAVMDAATSQLRNRWLARMVAGLPIVGTGTTAQDDRDVAAAEQSAHEVAAGAGWVAQTVTVTVTVLEPGDLAAAVAELEHAAGVSQLRLRRLTDQQAAGFVAGLPTGLTFTDLAARRPR